MGQIDCTLSKRSGSVKVIGYKRRYWGRGFIMGPRAFMQWAPVAVNRRALGLLILHIHVVFI